MNPTVIPIAPGWTLDGHPVIGIEIDAVADDPCGAFVCIVGNRPVRMRNEQDQDVRYGGEPPCADTETAFSQWHAPAT